MICYPGSKECPYTADERTFSLNPMRLRLNAIKKKKPSQVISNLPSMAFPLIA